jgi:hypothetical protein
MIAIGVEPEYRSVRRSLSRWCPKREPNAPIVAGSEVTDFLRQRRSCSCSYCLLWNIRVLNWICLLVRDEDVMLSHSGLSCPADWAWICSFWGGMRCFGPSGVGSEGTQVDKINLRWTWGTGFRLIQTLWRVITLCPVWICWCWFVDCFYYSFLYDFPFFFYYSLSLMGIYPIYL